MSLDQNLIISNIISSVNYIIELFQENPFNFLYESEIQAVLYSKLNADANKKIELPVEMEESLKEIGKDSITTNIVRAEYPSGKRFDIAIIHPDSKRHRGKGDLNEAFWNENILGAIELKYCQLHQGHFVQLMGFKDNLKKLEEFKNPESRFELKIGLALLFVQERQISEYYVEKAGLELVEITQIEQISVIEGYIITKDKKYKVTKRK